MSPEEQRIAIAQACGWKYLRLMGRGPEWWFAPPHVIERYKPEVVFDKPQSEWRGDIIGGMKALPDYLNDLNAMHEAEKHLDPVVHLGRYIFNLQTLCGGQFFGQNYLASAAQRAEAFIRTIGRWQDAPVQQQNEN